MNTPKVKKGTIETVKTVTIAVLVTALIAFIGGMCYANSQNDRVDQAVKASLVSVQAETKK